MSKLDDILRPIYNYGWPGTGYNAMQEQTPLKVSKQQIKDIILGFADELDRLPILDGAQGWSNQKKDFYVHTQAEMRRRASGKLRLMVSEL